MRLPRDLIERVRALARDHDRSLSAELRHALRQYVERASLRPGGLQDASKGQAEADRQASTSRVAQTLRHLAEE